MDFVNEFKTNVRLLLLCYYPGGLNISQLSTEYHTFFDMWITPDTFLTGKGITWETVFKQPGFREDISVFDLGIGRDLTYIKATEKMTHEEMMIIAKLARHSHLVAIGLPTRGTGSRLNAHGGVGVAMAHEVFISSQAPSPSVATSHAIREMEQLFNDMGGDENAPEEHNEVIVIPGHGDISLPPAKSACVKNAHIGTGYISLPQAEGAAVAEKAPKGNAKRERVKAKKGEKQSAKTKKSEKSDDLKCPSPGCDKEFLTKQELIAHKRMSCEYRKHVCDRWWCKRRFTTRGDLRSHLKIHLRSEAKCTVPGCSALLQNEKKRLIHEYKCHVKFREARREKARSKEAGEESDNSLPSVYSIYSLSDD